MQDHTAKKGFRSFSPMFWLVVMFEFFERGSYYGMMSILSVYLTENLHFAKESVGLIKGTIQPLLYFLPIISGALADRFGYRRMLMAAFSLLGLGYFLTAQATTYALVFGALVVMGFGAGTFKPIISGTIARVTDKKNSTLGFGIFYWSINLGAFLFPLILVPVLKKMSWNYVIIASAIGTAAMLIPTIFFFKDPIKKEKNQSSNQTNLIQTLANAFEIIYSPIVLLYYSMKKTVLKKSVILIILLGIFGYSFYSYLKTPVSTGKYPTVGIEKGQSTLLFTVNRDMLAPNSFKFVSHKANGNQLAITIFKPRQLASFANDVLDSLHQYTDFSDFTLTDVEDLVRMSDHKVQLSFTRGELDGKSFVISKQNDDHYSVLVNNNVNFNSYKDNLIVQISQIPILRGIELGDLEKLYDQSNTRSFFLLYIAGIILLALGITTFSNSKSSKSTRTRHEDSYLVPFLVVAAVGAILWFLPGLTTLGRIISYVIYLTVTSLFIIDKSEPAKFIDHAKFY